MNPTLSKRKYENQEELERDFWRLHYARGTVFHRPNARLGQLMQRDGTGSLADRLWHNQVRMLNGGGCWLPSHGKTTKRLFSPKTN